MAVTKEDLLRKRFGVVPVELPDVGTVEIRPLSRAEALGLEGKELKVSDMERILVSLAMVSPQLTQAEVAEWQDNSPAGELQILTDRIAEISGMNVSAGKSGVPGV